jgi:nucleotide-binding universal stress UspA family protein
VSTEAAFNYCLTVADKEDHVTLLAVAERIHTQLYAHAYVSSDFMVEAQHKIDDASKSLLRKHARTAHEAGVKNVHLLLATSDHPGDSIVAAAKEKQIDTILIGRRGMGAFKRLLLGSVSRYVVENAPCDVLVIKVPKQTYLSIAHLH